MKKQEPWIKKKAVTVENDKKWRLDSAAIELKRKTLFDSSPNRTGSFLTTAKFKNEYEQLQD